MKTIIHIIYPAVKTVTRKLAAFAALTLICATASASPPGTGGGTIYYTHACCRTMRSMNSDGSNQTALGVGTYGPPSMVMYNNHRWFLNTMPVTPQGTIRTEAPESKSSRSATTTTTTSTTTARQGSSLPTTSRYKPGATDSTRCTGFPETRSRLRLGGGPAP